MKRKKWYRKLGNWLFKTSLVLFLTLCLVELIYRYQWVDFYKTEWEFQNKNAQPDNHKTRILVFGDSFSADTSSWVANWGKADSLQVFNAAIPGTGPEVFRLIAPNRMDEIKPNVVVVQLFEGNDLYDLRKPVNWSAHSFMRNVYWGSSNTFRSLGFINYRLGQAKTDVNYSVNSKKQLIFRKDRYDPRTRLYIAGEPNYPSGMVLLKGDYAGDMQKMIAMLKEIREEAGSETRFYVLTVPSCVQVHKRYFRHYKRLGATNDERMLSTHPWANALKKAGFNVIDPLEAFRTAENRGEELYYANDPHLNAKGQEILLRCVRKKVKL